MGNSPIAAGRAPIAAFYSASSWIEGAAVRQIEQVAALPGVAAVAGMPDLHPGKYGPAGAAILADAIHPRLVGSDIGCGMALFALDEAVRKLRLDRAADRLTALDRAYDGDAAAELSAAGLDPSAQDASLGTIGGGNHFCEVQAIEEIVDAEAAARAGLDRSRVHLLVHSGSRGLGQSVLLRHAPEGVDRLDPAGEAGRAYAADHAHALRWACANRAVIARRASQALRCDGLRLADLPHNFMELRPDGVLHRKGAAPADRGFVPVPGSRGTLSYLVEPLPAPPASLATLAHGAGRKYDRGSMHGRIRAKRSDLERLARNPFGGFVVCEDRDMLIEEAPEAYKNPAGVIGDLVAHGLARVVATFRPLVTFKTARVRR